MVAGLEATENAVVATSGAVAAATDAAGLPTRLKTSGRGQGSDFGHGTGSEHHCAKAMTQKELVEEVRTALGRFLP